MPANNSIPKVSIVIPTYNAGAFLEESIQSAISQNHKELEILIINDGSTDNSIENLPLSILNQVKIITQHNQGKPAAMNLALKTLDTNYYCILDADDTISPFRISTQIEAILQHKTAALFCGHQLIFEKNLVAPRHRNKNQKQCKRDIDNFSMPAHDPTALYDFKTVQRYRYNTQYPGAEGYDYILRIGEEHPIASIDNCLYNYRIHQNSITRSNIEKRVRMIHSIQNDARLRRGIQPTEFTLPDLKSNSVSENNISTHFLESVTDLKKRKDYSSAFKTALFCAKLHPTDFEYWKPLAAAVLPNFILNILGRKLH